nr:hypothetical protein [Cryobacterium melibiosiphilum]
MSETEGHLNAIRSEGENRVGLRCVDVPSVGSPASRPGDEDETSRFVNLKIPVVIGARDLQAVADDDSWQG